MKRSYLSVFGFLEYLAALLCAVAAVLAIGDEEVWRWTILAVVFLNGGTMTLHIADPAEDAHGGLTVESRSALNIESSTEHKESDA